jgi:hypothetical protein
MHVATHKQIIATSSKMLRTLGRAIIPSKAAKTAAILADFTLIEFLFKSHPVSTPSMTLVLCVGAHAPMPILLLLSYTLISNHENQLLN